MSSTRPSTPPPESFLAVAAGTLFAYGTSRRSKDLLCADVDQRILIREDGSGLAVLRYYRPAHLDHYPEHYPLTVANTEPNARTKKRFLVLSQGVLSLELFPMGQLFIPKNAWVREPPGPSLGSWIDCGDRALAAEFEKLLFGGTLEEITNVAFAYHCVVRGIVPKKNPEKLVRVTMSKKQDNQCGFSAAFIPKGFPYLVFDDDSSGPFAHVALSSFYRHLAFHCRGWDEGGKTGGSQMFSRIIAAGVDATVLTRFCEIGQTRSRRALIHWSSVEWPTT